MSQPLRILGDMDDEQAFEKVFDTEHLFVLQCQGSEQVFEGGHAMSVALELEYEEFYPRLALVPEVPARTGASTQIRRRRLVLGLVVGLLLVLLMLPLQLLGGKTISGAVPSAGQEYVVQPGDTIASVAAQVDSTNVAGMERQLAHESGSTVLVPGEHLLIP